MLVENLDLPESECRPMSGPSVGRGTTIEVKKSQRNIGTLKYYNIETLQHIKSNFATVN